MKSCLKTKLIYSIYAYCFLFLGWISNLNGNSSSWTSPNGSSWNSSSNWVGGNIPMNAGDSAGFIGFPSSNGAQTVTIDEAVTIGSLHMDPGHNPTDAVELI